MQYRLVPKYKQLHSNYQYCKRIIYQRLHQAQYITELQSEQIQRQGNDGELERHSRAQVRKKVWKEEGRWRGSGRGRVGEGGASSLHPPPPLSPPLLYNKWPIQIVLLVVKKLLYRSIENALLWMYCISFFYCTRVYNGLWLVYVRST